jgi:septation ring formation regulator EzrA
MRLPWRPAFPAMLLAAALLALGVACGGDDTKSTSGGSSATGAKTLTVCEYNDRVQAIFDRLEKDVTASFASVSNKDQLVKAVDQLETDLNTSINDLKALKPPKEAQQVNGQLISALDDFKKQLPDIKKAASAGDLAKLTSLAEKAGTDFSNRVDKIEKDNAGVAKQFEACPKK